MQQAQPGTALYIVINISDPEVGEFLQALSEVVGHA